MAGSCILEIGLGFAAYLIEKRAARTVVGSPRSAVS